MTDWPVKTLGELFEFKNGRGFRKTEWSTSGLPIIRIQNLNSDSAPYNYFSGTFDEGILVEAGDLLFSWSGSIGTSFGPHVWRRSSGLLNQHIFKVIPKVPMNTDYAHYCLRVITAEIERSVNGAVGLVHITKEKLNKFEIPVPPLEEQKRIVALLDAATARVTELTACYEQARTHANDLLESSLLELFTDAFESQPKRKMGEVLQIARGGSPRPISEYITKSPNGVNWIKIGDASSSTKYIYETAQKIKPEGVSRSRMVYPGDFLLSNSMSFGRPYIMKTEGCIHDGWLVLRDSKGELDQDFLFYLLGSRFMYEKFSQLAAGSTVQNLNSALVSSVEIPVPPIDFQKRIAEKARLLEENVARLNEVNEIRLQRATDLRQSILEAAFAGDL